MTELVGPVLPALLVRIGQRCAPSSSVCSPAARAEPGSLPFGVAPTAVFPLGDSRVVLAAVPFEGGVSAPNHVLPRHRTTSSWSAYRRFQSRTDSGWQPSSAAASTSVACLPRTSARSWTQDTPRFAASALRMCGSRAGRLTMILVLALLRLVAKLFPPIGSPGLDRVGTYSCTNSPLPQPKGVGQRDSQACPR